MGARKDYEALPPGKVLELLEAVRLRDHLTDKQLAHRFGKSEPSIKGLIRRARRNGAL